LNAEKYPIEPEDRERYFLAHVTQAETLLSQGSLLPTGLTLGTSQYLSAAKEFCRALKVYPNPQELLLIYESAVPKVFAL
jgi:mitochondrial import receptor subunit TOM20